MQCAFRKEVMTHSLLPLATVPVLWAKGRGRICLQAVGTGLCCFTSDLAILGFYSAAHWSR